ncbi:MAG TPA: endonuclease domain-containing protein [Salinimicrobium catena]|uniref:Endonuclease domain-containing protein n=1 Tax=Salinimicrobium catena TaxID=390640 RepID=A0A7C2M9Z3_9FLAO|nr:endonuclease domain-containing protein [Salinimicrobium catena]
MWKGAPAQNFSRAQELRSNLTAAEKKLWERLQLEPFKKNHFRRQHPLQNFIVDFYSHSLKLVIEIDGPYHQSEIQKMSDEKRTGILEFQGVSVIRFTNEEIINEMEKVVEKLVEFIELPEK